MASVRFPQKWRGVKLSSLRTREHRAWGPSEITRAARPTKASDGSCAAKLTLLLSVTFAKSSSTASVTEQRIQGAVFIPELMFGLKMYLADFVF